VQLLTSGWQEYAIEAERTGAEDDIFAVDRVYPNQNEIQFPPLEDAESVQLATSMLFQAIATGNINFKRARLLLYTLKIATINLRVVATQARFIPDTSAIPTNIVRTTDGHILAAPEEASAPATELSTESESAAESAPNVAPAPDRTPAPLLSGALAPGACLPLSPATLNPSELTILDVTLADRGFYAEPQQLCH
jgi:hypothetical protein